MHIMYLYFGQIHHIYITLNPSPISLFFIKILVVLGFELRALLLLGKYSSTWATHPDLLFWLVFQIGSCALVQAGLPE
jgi:hypothetical protein